MRIVRVAVVAAVLGLLGLLVWDVAHGNGGRVAQKVDQGRKVPAPKLDLPRLDAGGRLTPRLAPRQGRRRQLLGVLLRPVQAGAGGSPTPRAPGRSKGVVFLGVDAFERSGAARAYLSRYGVDYANIRDGVGTSCRQLGRDRGSRDVLHRPARPRGAAAHHRPGIDARTRRRASGSR